MPLFKLPSGEIVSAVVKFGVFPRFCTVMYNDLVFHLYYDPLNDSFYKSEDDLISDTIVKQVNEYIHSKKVDLTDYGHFLVTLEDEEYRYYASCNFHYYKDEHGICPSGAVQVSLLDPRRGSITTMFEYDEELDVYVIAPDFEPLDTLQIDALSQAIKEYKKRIA